MDETDVNKSAEPRSPKKKPSSKVIADETEPSTKTTEKKRKAPKKPTTDQEVADEIKNQNGDSQTPSAGDQEVPAKPKKKRAPKVEVNNEDIESVPTDQPVKKKKPKAPKAEVNDENNENIESVLADQPVKKKKPKAPKIVEPPSLDDAFQDAENAAIDQLEPYFEPKPKTKKSKKSAPKSAGSFEDLQVTNLDDTYSTNQELYMDRNDSLGEIPLDQLPPSDENYNNDNNTSEYERTILDAYENLRSQIQFSQYVGNDQWCIINPPKLARTEPKSRLRKMLPGGSKDEKTAGGKPPPPKTGLLKRMRNGFNTLVRDENNLLFGERSNYDLAEEEDDPDGVDTDDLHRYAQKLRELEDQDREINPEYLVLRDGKTVYGVHEEDADGKVKLSTRKPIYDRFADQKPDEQAEKRKLLQRLKNPFSRSKDKDGKDNGESTTPDPRSNRKASRKSNLDDLTFTTNDDPIMT